MHGLSMLFASALRNAPCVTARTAIRATSVILMRVVLSKPASGQSRSGKTRLPHGPAPDGPDPKASRLWSPSRMPAPSPWTHVCRACTARQALSCVFPDEL